MPKQLMIAVSREFGSGGHEIANLLGRRFSLPVYEDNMLREIAQKWGMDHGKLERYDEQPKNRLMYRTVKGYSNAPGDVIAQMQFEYLRERAAAGDSFVVVGRCAEEILKDYPGLVSIFVLADTRFKVERTMAHGDISRAQAQALLELRDRKRKMYHNQYCKGKWGHARCYHICVNSAKLGIDGTAGLLEWYIRTRMDALES